jgi:hypothetical protein
MEMKPGARPHWGMKAVSIAVRQLLDLAGGGDVLGEVEIVGARRLGGFGDQEGQVIGRGAEHGELVLKQGGERIAVADVQHHGLDPGSGTQPGELLSRAVGDRELVVAGGVQHHGDRRPDVAGPDDDDVLHGGPLYRSNEIRRLLRR